MLGPIDSYDVRSSCWFVEFISQTVDFLNQGMSDCSNLVNTKIVRRFGVEMDFGHATNEMIARVEGVDNMEFRKNWIVQ